VDVATEIEAAHVFPVTAFLANDPTFLFFYIVAARFRGDRQGAVFQLDVNVLALDAGQFGCDFVVVGFFMDVDAGSEKTRVGLLQTLQRREKIIENLVEIEQASSWNQWHGEPPGGGFGSGWCR
jgi:hypothetical protein